MQPTGTAVVYSSQLSIDTWNYASYLRTEHNSAYNMDYRVLNWDRYRENRTHAPHTYDTIVLENDYLVATVIPALGGRVYSLTFKPTGSNAFYSNTTIKPTHWGPPEQGWWLGAGGMEWCLPVDEHGYEWGIRWEATTGADPDGAYITLTDTTRSDRLRARVTVRLPHDEALLAVTIRVENPSSRGYGFKYWTNVQVAPGPDNTLSADFRFVLPTDQVTIHSAGDSRVPSPGQAMSWPTYRGWDWSRLGTWNEWIGFFARPQASAGFQGVYDPSVDEGLARVFPREVARGAKGFAWGWNNAMPAYYWTGDGSTYAEVHGGLAPTFWDSAYLPAGGAIQWTERWYPVAGIGSLVSANDRAALNLQVNGTQVTVGAQPTGIEPDGQLLLWRPGETAPLWQTTASLSPALPVQTTLSPGGDLSEPVLVYLDAMGDLLATTDPSPDRGAPMATVESLPPYVTAPEELVVSWSGSDGESCVLEYDLQVRDGYTGTWTDWLTRTTAVSATYGSGVDGHTYFFRARARDLYGNLGAYGGGETWGQAYSSLLVTPQSVLVASRKELNRRLAVGGDVLTYTLSLRNTGNVDTGTVWMTDTIPAELEGLTDTLRLEGGGVAGFDGDTVRWTGTISAGQWAEVQFAARVLSDTAIDLRSVTNGMTVTHEGTSFEREGAFVLGYGAFLPVIAREGEW